MNWSKIIVICVQQIFIKMPFEKSKLETPRSDFDLCLYKPERKNVGEWKMGDRIKKAYD